MWGSLMRIDHWHNGVKDDLALDILNIGRGFEFPFVTVNDTAEVCWDQTSAIQDKRLVDSNIRANHGTILQDALNIAKRIEY